MSLSNIMNLEYEFCASREIHVGSVQIQRTLYAENKTKIAQKV